MAVRPANDPGFGERMVMRRFAISTFVLKQDISGLPTPAKQDRCKN